LKEEYLRRLPLKGRLPRKASSPGPPARRERARNSRPPPVNLLRRSLMAK